MRITHETPTVALTVGLRTTFQNMWRLNPLLIVTGLAMLPVFVIAIIGLFIDPQVITGVPAWIKPLKFAISVSIYALTLSYLLTFVEGRRRTITIVTTVTAVGLLVEMVVITLQVVRGTTSHFNLATPFDSAAYSVMGILIATVWVMGVITAIVLLRQRLSDPAWAWSLRLGMITALVGMAVAFLMTIPTAAQLTSGVTIVGAHTVGVADGGPGLPLLGWSTVGGDLRIPHFFGLHGLQVLLVVGILVAQTASWLDVRHRVAIVVTAGVSYLALIIILTWQALRAQSIVHPDALTMSALVALVVITSGAIGGIVLHGRRVA